MNPFFLKSLGFTIISCLVFGNLAARNTAGTFSMLDKRALKEELGQ